jgi:hypothetical protein
VKRLAVVLLPLSFVLCPSSFAFAHKLNAGAVLLPAWQVQVEGWYETKEPASNAAVRVLDAAGKRIMEGTMDDRGIFIFSYENVQFLRIVINAGGGHRAEVNLEADQMRQHVLLTSIACMQPAPLLAAPLLVPVRLAEAPSPAPLPLVDRKGGGRAMNLVIGVAILAGIAAVAVQWKRMQQLRTPQEK